MCNISVASILLSPAFTGNGRGQFSYEPGGDGTPAGGPPKALTPRVTYVEREVAQAYLALGRPAVPQNDPRRYALAVLNALVGGADEKHPVWDLPGK